MFLLQTNVYITIILTFQNIQSQLMLSHLNICIQRNTHDVFVYDILLTLIINIDHVINTYTKTVELLILV